MPTSYPPEAIEQCLRLYLKYNGQQHTRIEKEMRRTWPGWSKQNLYSRGEKIGWIDKYGWEEALRLHLAQQPEARRTAADKIFSEIDEIRKKIFGQIKVAGARADRDLIYQHRDYTKLSIDALNKIGEGHNLDSFIAMWEGLLDWLPSISPKALTELLKVDNLILEKAALEYGDTEESRDGGNKD